MDVSIVTVNYNSSALLERMVATVPQSCGDLAHEIIVIDNCSRDWDEAALRRHFGSHRLVLNRQNRGFGCACNQGIREARGRYVALVNPDMLLGRDCLKLLCGYLDDHPEVGAAGPQLRNPDGSIQPSCRRLPTLGGLLAESLGLIRLFPKSRAISGYHMSGWTHDRESRVEQVMGACLVVKRSVLDKIGTFDERFFMYFEEVDLCRRLLASGSQIAFYPRAHAVHYRGESARTDKKNALTAFHASRRAYIRKYYGRLAGWLAGLLSGIDMALRSAFWLVRSRVHPDNPQARAFASDYFRALCGLFQKTAGNGRLP